MLIEIEFHHFSLFPPSSPYHVPATLGDNLFSFICVCVCVGEWLGVWVDEWTGRYTAKWMDRWPMCDQVVQLKLPGGHLLKTSHTKRTYFRWCLIQGTGERYPCLGSLNTLKLCDHVSGKAREPRLLLLPTVLQNSKAVKLPSQQDSCFPQR